MLVALLLGTTTTSSRGHTAPHLLHHPLQAIRRRRQRHTHCSGNCRSRGRLQPHSTATNVRVQPVTKGSRGGWSTDGTRSTHPHTNDVCRRVRDSTRDAAANKTSKTNRTAWPVLGRSQGRAGHAHDTFTHIKLTTPTSPRRQTWRRFAHKLNVHGYTLHRYVDTTQSLPASDST